MQQDTIALQVSRGPPLKSRTVEGETANCTCLILTLPKLYLATSKRYKIVVKIQHNHNGVPYCYGGVLCPRYLLFHISSKSTGWVGVHNVWVGVKITHRRLMAVVAT